MVALSLALGDGDISLGWVCAFMIVVCLWWIYFDWDYKAVDLKTTSHAFAYNYGHFVIYAALGIVSAGAALVSGDAHLLGNTFLIVGIVVFLLSLCAMNWIIRIAIGLLVSASHDESGSGGTQRA